jgi:hypothetical protein
MRRLAVLPLFAAACIIGEDPVEEVNPKRLTDQSGAVFGWDCTQYTGCEVRRISGSAPLPSCEGDDRAWYGYSWSRFISIDGACVDPRGYGGWEFVDEWSRMIVCETDADCPQLNFFLEPDEFECRAGYCQSTDHIAYPPDALPRRFEMIDLCLGDVAREDGWSDSEEFWAALDEACPADAPRQPCKSLPPGCPDTRE